MRDQYIEQAKISGFGDEFSTSMLKHNDDNGNASHKLTKGYIERMYNLHQQQKAVSNFKADSKELGYEYKENEGIEWNISMLKDELLNLIS
jgi:hypothetical protein